MNIREEIPNDVSAIRALTKKAFEPMPFSNGAEPRIIDALRNNEQLSLSLVAVCENEIVGQITFSPVTINGEHDSWFGLGPVSVCPDKQGQGIGSALILHGLEAIKEVGAKGCVLIGDPNYYSRFGFENNSGLAYKGLDKQFVQKLTFVAPQRDGELLYCTAFEEAAAT